MLLAALWIFSCAIYYYSRLSWTIAGQYAPVLGELFAVSGVAR